MNDSNPKASLVCLADVQPERIEWLWDGRIPFGTVTIIDGDPGLGKSLVTLDLVARVTTGLPMPLGGTAHARGAAILVAGEDHLATTLRPRLDAAGADVRLVHAVTAIPVAGDADAPPTLSEAGIAAIEDAVMRTGARIVVIDPLNNHIPGGVDPFKDHEIRRVMRPLANMAQRTGAAVLVVRHLKKGEGSALYRGAGSMGIIGAARSGLLVARDRDDPNRRMLAATKSNVAQLAPTVGFACVDAGGVPRVEWGELSNVTADDLAASSSPESQGKLSEACDALRRLLPGPRPACDVEAELSRLGFSAPTIRRAGQKLGLVREPSRDAAGRATGWIWSLPDDQPEDQAKPDDQPDDQMAS